MTFLTTAEYLERFSAAETARLTNQMGGVNVDTARLATVIADASAYAESFVVARYTLPFSTIPAVLKLLVGDLAREMLHVDYPTEEVTERAQRARADLKLIAAGTMALASANAAVPTVASGMPVASGRDTVFSDVALFGYA